MCKNDTGMVEFHFYGMPDLLQKKLVKGLTYIYMSLGYSQNMQASN